MLGESRRPHVVHRNRLAGLVLFLFSPAVLSSAFDPFEGPEPLAVLIEKDPWAWVLNADVPRVALYEDGTLIFLAGSGDGAEYRRAALSQPQLSGYRRQLAAAFALGESRFSYDMAPAASDMPETRIYVRDGARDVAIRVRGMRGCGSPRAGEAILPGLRGQRVPPEVLRLHERLCGAAREPSSKWVPRYVEAMLIPYESAPEQSIVWPKGWPGLDSDRAVRRGDAYSIFMDGSTLDELHSFLEKRSERGAVEIGGRPWVVVVRPIFPGEPRWQRALRRPVPPSTP
jgi:hypothetical protein